MLKITYSTLTLIVQIYISWFLGQGPPRIRHVNTTWGHLWIGKIQALKLENYEMHYLDISFLSKGPKHFFRSIIGPLAQQNSEMFIIRSPGLLVFVHRPSGFIWHQVVLKCTLSHRSSIGHLVVLAI